ncbi:MAG: efflux RND transporter periplasmic adaptor subunit [Phycisphaerales bacterium]
MSQVSSESAARTDSTPSVGESISRRLARSLAQLSEQTESRAMFVKRGAAEIVRAFNCPYGVVSVRFGAEVVEEYWHAGPTDPGFWKGPIDQLVSESLGEARSIARRFSSADAKFQIALISVVLRDVSGSIAGVLSVVARCDAENDAKVIRELLEAAASMLMFGASRVEAKAAAPKPDKPGDELSKAARYRTSTELAFALVSSVRNKFGCEQAAIGVAHRSSVKIVAVSGLDEFGKQGAAARQIRDAMGEAVDAGQAIACDTAEPGSYRVHRAWHEQAGRSPVASIPLAGEGETTLVVSLRRAGEARFTDEELRQAAELLAPYTPAFTLIDRASRSVFRHARDATRSGIHSLVRPGGWVRKGIVAATIGLGLWIVFGRVPHSVSAAAVIEPAVTRHMAAPITGVLASVRVAPGDAVTAGQVMATLETADFEVERQRLLADIEIARIKEDQAIASALSSEAALARAELRRASARLAEVEHRIERSVIRAPFDGLVTHGDLRSRVGETLTLGDPLFEVADLSSWTISADTPQRVAAALELGLTGEFAPTARPEDRRALSVTRIRPMPEVRNGQSVYVVEADLVEHADWIKPGMEGAARITVGERPVWWVMSHRVVNYFRMNFWL